MMCERPNVPLAIVVKCVPSSLDASVVGSPHSAPMSGHGMHSGGFWPYSKYPPAQRHSDRSAFGLLCVSTVEQGVSLIEPAGHIASAKLAQLNCSCGEGQMYPTRHRVFSPRRQKYPGATDMTKRRVDERVRGGTVAAHRVSSRSHAHVGVALTRRALFLPDSLPAAVIGHDGDEPRIDS